MAQEKIESAIQELKDFKTKQFTHLEPNDIKIIDREIKKLEDKLITHIDDVS